jgi:acetolactate synthase-1/2/3 large subunit
MTPDRDWVATTAAAWRAEHASLADDDAVDGPLHPVAVFDAVHAAMPEDTICVAGMGNVDFWSDTRIQVRAPNSFIRCGQGGAIGPDVPYGIGARVACPERPVVVFVGDGGFGYHGVELDTAERYGRPGIVVMMDDNCWGAIAMPEKRQYGDAFETDLAARDWAGFARALGSFGARAETVEDVGAAVRAAHASGKPALVQVPVRSVLSHFMDAVGF